MPRLDRKSTRLNSSHLVISYAVFCLKKKKKNKDSPLNDDNSAHRQHASVLTLCTCHSTQARSSPPERLLVMFLFFFFFFFFNDTAPPEIYPLSLPDAFPIFPSSANDGSLPVLPSTPASRARPCSSGC